MKIEDLFAVQQLEARRRRLLHLRAVPNLRARIGGACIGESGEDLDEKLIQQLVPIVVFNLEQQIDAIEDELRAFGVVIP